MNKYDKLEEIVGKDKVKYNEKMSKYTTMRVGGPCDCIVFPDEISKIKEVIDFCKNENITFFVIGNGSNLLVKDEGIHGVVIKLGHRFAKIELDGEYILAYAGATMPTLSQLAKKNSLKGLEFACGIPGTIGGGVKMNAGAYGSQISDILYEVTYMDEKEEIKTFKCMRIERYGCTFYLEFAQMLILQSAIYSLLISSAYFTCTSMLSSFSLTSRCVAEIPTRNLPNGVS